MNLEKVHQDIKPCTVSELKSYMHLTMKHTIVAYSVTSVLTKNQNITIKSKFLPSSYQNDGKRGIYFGSEFNNKPRHCKTWSSAGFHTQHMTNVYFQKHISTNRNGED